MRSALPVRSAVSIPKKNSEPPSSRKTVGADDGHAKRAIDAPDPGL